jgi:hypothetical protein
LGWVSLQGATAHRLSVYLDQAHAFHYPCPAQGANTSFYWA